MTLDNMKRMRIKLNKPNDVTQYIILPIRWVERDSFTSQSVDKTYTGHCDSM